MKFTTRSHCAPSYYVSMAAAWAICAAATYAMVPHTLSATLITQGFVLLIIVICLLVLVPNQRWQLDFEGDTIHLTHNKREQYVCYDMHIADCKLKCTSVAKDRGNLFIKDTIFNIRGIENFSQMKNYIETNFH